MSDTNNPFSFDKNGQVYKAARYRDTFTIKEFAQFLADADASLMPDNWAGSEIYDSVIGPWELVLFDAVEGMRETEEQRLQELLSEEIPF